MCSGTDMEARQNPRRDAWSRLQHRIRSRGSACWEHPLEAINVLGQGGLIERVGVVPSPLIHPCAESVHVTGKQLLQQGGCFCNQAATADLGDVREQSV